MCLSDKWKMFANYIYMPIIIMQRRDRISKYSDMSARIAHIFKSGLSEILYSCHEIFVYPKTTSSTLLPFKDQIPQNYPKLTRDSQVEMFQTRSSIQLRVRSAGQPHENYGHPHRTLKTSFHFYHLRILTRISKRL
jgi:hypothetical protein